MKIGGIETSFFIFANYLKSKGHDVSVRYSVCDPMRLKKYRDAGIDIDREKKEICDILFVGSIYRHPKLVTAKLTVQQIHADYSDPFWEGAVEGVRLIKTYGEESDVFCPVCESSAGFIESFVTKPIIVMNNLAPEKQIIKKKKNNKLVIAAFTRMSTEKGLKNYEALRDRLQELNIESELRCYTTGEVPDGWIAKEPVPDIRTELSDIDFVASLADTESFGYTIAEANSCGIPCIIKRTNSTKEFYSDKNNIIMDSVSSLIKKDLCRKMLNYDLYDKTKKSVDDGMKQLESMVYMRDIIIVMKGFYDIQARKNRLRGETISVSRDRANELLNHEANIARKI